MVFRRVRREAKSYKPISHPLATPAGEDTSYPSQFPQPHLQRDVESGSEYRGQATGVTGGAAPYDPYKPSPSYGDVGLAHNSPQLMSPGVPQVYVQQYDHNDHRNVYEMDSRRNLAQ